MIERPVVSICGVPCQNYQLPVPPQAAEMVGILNCYDSISYWYFQHNGPFLLYVCMLTSMNGFS